MGKHVQKKSAPCPYHDKSTIGAAIAEYLYQAQKRAGRREAVFPAIVTGPGIVTGAENWPREIRDVLPDAESRVVQTGARPLARAVCLGEWLKSKGFTLNEADYAGLSPFAVMERLKRLAKKAGAILSSREWQALKQALLRAERRPAARGKPADQANLLEGRIGGYLWLDLDMAYDAENAKEAAGKYSAAQFVDEYRRGLLPEKTFAILSFETAKLGPGRLPAYTTRRIRLSAGGTAGDPVTVCACPHCGAVIQNHDSRDENYGAALTPDTIEEFVARRRRFCDAPVTKWIWDSDLKEHVLVDCDPRTGKTLVCGAPLFEESLLRREAAADYIRKKARGVFGYFVCDEVHKAKAGGSGVGQTLASLAGCSRWTVGLTGTLFGGQSTSIFHLWYRLVPGVRSRFGFDEAEKWAGEYGLITRTYMIDRSRVGEDGAFTGKRFNERVDEAPGISPKIMKWGLGHCTFSSLNDIGLPLPGYSEEVIPIAMNAEMQAQMAMADGSSSRSGLFSWALDRLKEPKGAGALLIWQSTALNRPNCCFRPESIHFRVTESGFGRWARRHVEHVLDLPGLTGILPKERWLVETVRKEARQNRKVLVYLRQTGLRDIQDRLKMVLEEAGLRVGILRPSLAPTKRAAWLKNTAGKVDVMLTNSRLVEVGLNLTMFSTAVFFELEWSLYAVWQAMRRLYRPGAPQPVKLLFPVYTNTLEEHVIKLVGAKMSAAQKMYGDSVSGALVEESSGSGDVLDQLLRSLIKGESLGRIEGGETVFGSLHPALEAPALSPAVRMDGALDKAVLPAPAEGWSGRLPERTEETVLIPIPPALLGRKQKKLVEAGQLSLF